MTKREARGWGVTSSIELSTPNNGKRSFFIVSLSKKNEKKKS